MEIKYQELRLTQYLITGKEEKTTKINTEQRRKKQINK